MTDTNVEEAPEVITKDRSKICEIISEMLDNPDESGIYPTTAAYNKLEQLISDVRSEAVVWMFNECYNFLQNGGDLIHLEKRIKELKNKIQSELNPPDK